MRLPNYIAKTSPCHRRRTVRKCAGGIFETLDMANHSPSRLYFGFWMNSELCLKKKTAASGKVINCRPKERALVGAEFQRGTQILKINRISLSYDLTSNKDKLLPIKVALFSCYIEKYAESLCHFRALWGHSHVWPLWIRP